jgi:sugar O-acyltransferase (sialic acid O-acetyltransferase NeuD family)
MIIAGAGGHARELLGILAELKQTDEVYLLDDVSPTAPDAIWERFPVIRSAAEAKDLLSKDPRFIIGVGKPALRQALCEKLMEWGGEPFSLISPFASVGNFNVHLEKGLNIMTYAVITQDVTIGMGTLIHIHATIHHDCTIGKFCELSPGCHLLGNVTLGDLVSVGSGAIILPGIIVGDKAIIGAGAVVTKNIPTETTVKGIPAKQ